jgi:hypothetical protein
VTGLGGLLAGHDPHAGPCRIGRVADKLAAGGQIFLRLAVAGLKFQRVGEKPDGPVERAAPESADALLV